MLQQIPLLALFIIYIPVPVQISLSAFFDAHFIRKGHRGDDLQYTLL